MSNDERMLLALSCEYCENFCFVQMISNSVPQDWYFYFTFSSAPLAYSCNKKIFCSFLIVSTALRSSQCCCTAYAFDSSCPVAKVADAKTNQMSFGEGLRDPLEEKVLEKHIVFLRTQLITLAKSNVGVRFRGLFCFVLFKKKQFLQI